jgi:hypothetical protein
VLLIRLVELVVVFAATVIVPLGLSAAAQRDRTGKQDRFERAVMRIFPLAGLSLLAAMHWHGTAIAFVVGCVYVGACVMVALVGARRFARRSRLRLEEIAIDLGMVYLVVGGAWTFAYVNELAVMGFAGLQCLLTAAHFHYAGFGACVVAGSIGRAIPARGPIRLLYVPATVGMMSGIALLAAGIAAWHPLERVAAWVVACSLVSLGLVLLFRASRSGRMLARFALALAGLSTLCSGALAAWFSATGFAMLGYEALKTMIALHGLVNALGFVGLGLLGLRLLRAESRAAPGAIPFSRLSGGLRTIGPTFFARNGIEDDERTVAGLLDDLDEYARDGFDAKAIDPAVRSFYENTRAWTLWVSPEWQPGWGLAGRIWRSLARRMNQLNLPWDRAAVVRPVTSRMVSLRADRDGRPSPRGWVRTYRAEDGSEGEAVYVAAYASHVHQGLRYMNIAFALPTGNMTSLLRMDPHRDGGLVLSTLGHPSETTDGDQGVYFIHRLGVLRLPVNETICVWSTKRDEGWAARHPPPDGVDASKVELLAIHDMWLLGMRYLRLTYHITRAEDAGRSATTHATTSP